METYWVLHSEIGSRHPEAGDVSDTTTSECESVYLKDALTASLRLLYSDVYGAHACVSGRLGVHLCDVFAYVCDMSTMQQLFPLTIPLPCARATPWVYFRTSRRRCHALTC